jgi:hypothetical protein
MQTVSNGGMRIAICGMTLCFAEANVKSRLQRLLRWGTPSSVVGVLGVPR